MPIRISGLVSGLDTESLVSELVSAYSIKKDNYTKAQTKLSWKQDAWKNLNKKVYSLYSSISSLRYSSAYSLKKTTVSDTTKATVTAANNAVNGTQKLVVKSLAATGYLTGGVLKATGDNSKATATSKLSELKGNGFGLSEGESSSINVNGKEVTLSASDSITNVVNKLKDAGVNASFDEKNQRIFVSSKDSGTDNEFTLTASNENGAKALQSLGLMTAATEKSSAYKEYNALVSAWTEDGAVSTSKIRSAIASGTLGVSDYGDAAYQTAVKTYNYASALKDGTEAATKLGEDYSEYLSNQAKLDQLSERGFNKAIYDGLKASDASKLNFVYMTEDGTQVSTDDTGKIFKDGKEVTAEDGYTLEDGKIIYRDPSDPEAEEVVYEKAADKLAAMQTVLTDIYGGTAEEAYEAYTAAQKSVDGFKASYGNDLDILATVYADDADLDALMSDNLTIASDAFADKVTAAQKALSGSGVYAATADAVRINAENAEIELNGAKFVGSSNDFSINGLSISVTGTTDDNGITITTSTDSQAIYDKIKDFLEQYNDLMNEMCSLYNAASAKGYEPLTSDEKSAMTDTQIEEWEAKVKSALLRRDSTLDSLITAMSGSMQKSYVMGKDANGNNITFTLNKDGSYAGSNGKTYQLQTRNNGKYTMLSDDGSTLNAASYSWSSFGVATLGILNASENEYNAYHIDGDADDELTSGKTNKLLAAISEDPDSVIDFLKNATSSLYDSIGNKMTSTTLRSAYTVYNDKEMSKEYSDLSTTIKKWDEKVTSIEDSYYKKFAAMESALATLQGQSSSLSSLF